MEAIKQLYMIQTIESIAWLVSLVVGIWFMVSKKSKIPDQQQSLEPLSGKEKLLVFVLCVFNPLILGAVFYYGWKNKLPKQAKTANYLSFAGFFIFLVIYFGSVFLFVKKVGLNNVENMATNLALVKSLDQQATVIATTPDAADAADIKAIQDKVSSGYDKAKQWQTDAKWYSYRRVFNLPDNVSENDKITAQADSFYYESQSTKDVDEILFDRNSNNVLRIDNDPNQRQTYVNNFTDIFTLKVGPKKALEIAMLSPDFQNYKQSHSQLLTFTILNAVDNAPASPNLPKYWYVGMAIGFSDPNGVYAFVDSQTGELISKEAIDTVNQLNSAAQK